VVCTFWKNWENFEPINCRALLEPLSCRSGKLMLQVTGRRENRRKGMAPRAGVEPAHPFGQRILSPVIGPLPNLTKRYKPVFTRLGGRQGIASAGLVRTCPATILGPSSLKPRAELIADGYPN
jgi:hypothetical protein